MKNICEEFSLKERLALLNCSTVSPVLIEEFAQDDCEDLQLAISKTRLPITFKTVSLLAFSKFPKVKASVASNIGSYVVAAKSKHYWFKDEYPEEVKRLLRVLAKDASPIVRAAVATQSVYRDDSLFENFAQDPSPIVRSALAGHQWAPEVCLVLLAKDSISGVAKRARQTLKLSNRKLWKALKASGAWR